MHPLVVVLSVITGCSLADLIPPSYIAHCPTNDVINDTIRQKFLDVHNELRALVASGKAKDKLGGFAPSAAAMPKLKYDCNIEQYAVTHAAKCVYQHSTREDRGGTGENIFMSTPAYDDPLDAADEATRYWFAELIDYGVGSNLILDDAMWDRHVGHYTQMVWQTTTAIGCTVQKCRAMSFVVCNYIPPGNLEYFPLYEKGAPCSKCPYGCENNLCVDKPKPTEAPEPETTKVVTPSTTAATSTTKASTSTTKAATTAAVTTKAATSTTKAATTTVAATTPTTTTVLPKPVVKPSNNSKNKKKKNKKQKNKKKKNNKNKTKKKN